MKVKLSSQIPPGTKFLDVFTVTGTDDFSRTPFRVIAQNPYDITLDINGIDINILSDCLIPDLQYDDVLWAFIYWQKGEATPRLYRLNPNVKKFSPELLKTNEAIVDPLEQDRILNHDPMLLDLYQRRAQLDREIDGLFRTLIGVGQKPNFDVIIQPKPKNLASDDVKSPEPEATKPKNGKVVYSKESEKMVKKFFSKS